MANNNSIFTDSDGQKKIDDYVKSFDSLRDSINNLSRPINSFSTSINNLNKNLAKYTDSLSKFNIQNQELVSLADKSENKIFDLSNSFATLGNIITLLKNTIKGWTAALTGGLAIITTFAPEIVKWVTALYKGKDALDTFIQNFKNFNDVMKSSNKEASSEITRLQILYKSATDVNNSYDDEAVS